MSGYGYGGGQGPYGQSGPRYGFQGSGSTAPGYGNPAGASYGATTGGQSYDYQHHGSRADSSTWESDSSSNMGAQGSYTSPVPSGVGDSGTRAASYGGAGRGGNYTGTRGGSDSYGGAGVGGNYSCPGSGSNYTGSGGSGNYTGSGGSGSYGGSGLGGNYDRTGSAGAYDRTGSAGAYDRTGSAGAYDRTGSAGAYGRTGSAGTYDRTGSAGAYDRTGSAGAYDRTGSAGAYDRTGSAGAYDRTGSAGAYDRTGSAGSYDRTTSYSDYGRTGQSGGDYDTGAGYNTGTSGSDYYSKKSTSDSLTLSDFVGDWKGNNSWDTSKRKQSFNSGDTEEQDTWKRPRLSGGSTSQGSIRPPVRRFSYFSTKTYAVGTQKNHIKNEMFFFEHPQHMLKLTGKKIFSILCSKILFI